MFFYSTPVAGHLLDPNAAPINNPLPDGLLCLTYDDGPGVTSTPTGPGSRTDDLGFYLFLQGIPATFFVIGQRAENEPQLCLQLRQQGHLLSNHSQKHKWMPWEAVTLDLNDPNHPPILLADVLDADSNIGAATNPNSLLLRPPYLAWDANVANVLNGDARTRKFTGPIWGDIGAYDWMFWDNAAAAAAATNGLPWLGYGQTPQDCANRYYADITAAGSGIVVMHDCASLDDPTRAATNQTYEMTKLLIPRLIADGYRFVRLDALPQVRSAMLVNSIVGLKAANGLYVSPQGGGGGGVFANGPALNAWEELGLVQLGGDNVAIRTPNGQFLSANPNTKDVLADGNGPYSWETFEFKDSEFGDGSVSLKSLSTSHYVSAPNSGQINASATNVGPTERFMPKYVSPP